MTDPFLPQAMQLVLDQLQEQQAQQHAAQAAAYVALARHLAARGQADLGALACDLEAFAQAQTGEDYRAHLAALAAALQTPGLRP